MLLCFVKLSINFYAISICGKMTMHSAMIYQIIIFPQFRLISHSTWSTIGICAMTRKKMNGYYNKWKELLEIARLFTWTSKKNYVKHNNAKLRRKKVEKKQRRSLWLMCGVQHNVYLCILFMIWSDLCAFFNHNVSCCGF